MARDSISASEPGWVLCGQVQEALFSNVPLGHLAPEPDRLTGGDRVSGHVHQQLHRLVVVHNPATPHHISKTVDTVSLVEGIGWSGVTDQTDLVFDVPHWFDPLVVEV